MRVSAKPKTNLIYGASDGQLPHYLACAVSTVLKELRSASGLSQEELSFKSGLARSYICDVERSARLPSLKNIARLALSLELSPALVMQEAELKLLSLVDIDKLRNSQDMQGVQKEIIQYFQHYVSGGVIIADSQGFVLFNLAAEHLSGIGRQDSSPDQWSEVYGCFMPDRITPFPSAELPLVKAIAGKSTDDCEVFLRNNGAPEGRWLKAMGRPLKDDLGKLKGGVVLFWDISRYK